MNELIQAISTVGFPIVCCGLAFWYVKYQGDKTTKLLNEMNQSHRDEVMKLTETINNNTQALIALKESLGGK